MTTARSRPRPSLNALLDHLGVKKAIVLGHSLGGRTAIDFADRYPARVDKLVVEDMAFLPLTKQYPFDPGYQVKAAHFASLSGRFKTRAALEAEVRAKIPGEQGERMIQSGMRRHDDLSYSLKSPPDARLIEYNQGITEDHTGALNRLSVPTLVLVAEQHSDFTPEGLRHLKLNATGAAVRFIPGSHHSIHDSHPGLFVDGVTAFGLGRPLPVGLRKR